MYLIYSNSLCVSRTYASDVCGEIKGPSHNHGNRQFLERRNGEFKYILLTGLQWQDSQSSCCFGILRAGQMEVISGPASTELHMSLEEAFLVKWSPH